MSSPPEAKQSDSSGAVLQARESLGGKHQSEEQGLQGL